jgi:predicted transcriptional regulator of viral defense system
VVSQRAKTNENEVLTTSGRPKKSVIALQALPMFNLEEAERLGFSQATISRAVSRGEISRLEQNLYRHPESALDPQIQDFAIACAKFGPHSAIGALSALFHYGLLEQAPQQVWVIVPPQIRSRVEKYRCLRTETPLNIGVSREPYFRITTIERSLAEAMRHSTKIGLDTAIRACRQAFKDAKSTPEKVLRIARQLGFEDFIIRNWEAITLE